MIGANEIVGGLHVLRVWPAGDKEHQRNADLLCVCRRHVVEELDDSGNTLARNIWGNELLYRKNSTASDNQVGYYFYNGHEDVVSIKDADGSELNSYDYDIWGKVLTQSEGMENPFTYACEYQDKETGLYYLSSRLYDPSTEGAMG